MDVAAWLNWLSVEFSNLPRGGRVSIFVLCGLTLTYWAVPRFDAEFLTALLYMLLAVFFFWMAIAQFM
jgi:hypothetical protein